VWSGDEKVPTRIIHTCLTADITFPQLKNVYTHTACQHDEEEKSIIARFEKDVAESTAKVAQKKSLFDDATKLKSAAMKELKDTERKLYSAQGELSMAESEKQVADKKAAKVRRKTQARAHGMRVLFTRGW
jgi:hypothetical protein